MLNKILFSTLGFVLAFVIIPAPRTQAQNSGNGVNALTEPSRDALAGTSFVAQTKMLVESLTKDQQDKIRAILDNNKPPLIVKPSQTREALAAKTIEQHNQEGAQLKGMVKAVKDWTVSVNAEIKAVLNPTQAAAFDASRPPSPEEFPQLRLPPTTGSSYCYNAYYYIYNYIYSIDTYYEQYYAYYQVFYYPNTSSILTYETALAAYISSYYAYVNSYNSYAYDQSTYSYQAYYNSKSTTWQSYASENLAYNIGYLLDGSSNYAYYSWLYGYYANYYSSNYGDYYSYYCYLGY